MLSIKGFVQLALIKIRLNLKAEAKSNYLHYLWWLLEPLLHMMAYYLVFKILLKSGGDNFVSFLLVGLIPFLWFSHSVMNASNSLLNAKEVIGHVVINKLFFPIVVVGQDFIKQLVVFLSLTCLLLVTLETASLEWFLVIPLLILQLFFILGCASLIALLVPFVPDIKFVVTSGLQLLMFVSGIFYSYADLLVEKHKQLFLLNPIATFIESYRSIFLHNEVPNFNWIVYLLVITLVINIITVVAYIKLDKSINFVVME